jgi:nucleoside diphosphate kinase
MELCCIIKPNGIPDEDGMRELLAEGGITLRERRPITYTAEMIHRLYDHMTDEARSDIAREFEGKPGIALLIEAKSLRHLLAVAGHHSDPRKCKPGTIRARFGVHDSGMRMGTSPWWDNRFHRPKTRAEAARDLALIFGR